MLASAQAAQLPDTREAVDKLCMAPTPAKLGQHGVQALQEAWGTEQVFASPEYPPSLGGIHKGDEARPPLIDEVNRLAAQSLADRLPAMGYLRARVLPDGSVAALLDLMFTRAICLGCNEEAWVTRFCFEYRALADQRFAELMSEDDEPAGYVARRWQ